MFEPSERSRRSALAAAAKKLPPGTEARQYVIGRGNPRLTTGAIIAIGVFGLAFLVALAMGRIVVPGGLLAIVVYLSVMPPRGIVLTDQGVAIFGRSMFNGKPDRLLVQYPYETFATGAPVEPGRKATLHFGAEQVMLSAKELERLAGGISAVTGRPLTHPAVAGIPPG